MNPRRFSSFFVDRHCFLPVYLTSRQATDGSDAHFFVAKKRPGRRAGMLGARSAE